MKYLIKTEICEDNAKYDVEDIVEGKSPKDALKNWVFANFDKIVKKGFIDDGEFECEEWKAEVSKINQIKARPKEDKK